MRTSRSSTIPEAGTISSTLLKAGYATGLALTGNAVFGLSQILYRNHEGFRSRVDRLIDWIVKKGDRQDSPEVPVDAEDLSSRTRE